MNDFCYIGCFFDPAEIKRNAWNQERGRLHRVVRHPHVTFSYRPDEVPFDLFGSEVAVRVIGYGKNDENEAFLVELLEMPEGLLPLAETIRVPHITISVSERGKAVNSNKLKFPPVQPFIIKGIFGGEDQKGVLHLD